MALVIKLWKLLINEDMKKKDLREAADINSCKVCKALSCDISDIMEIVNDKFINGKW